MNEDKKTPFIFPRWVDQIRPVLGVFLLGVLPIYAIVLLYLGGSPETTDVGYRPVQPVHYSHAIHAGRLGIDCRYCHSTVEVAGKAAIPPTQTCMNCHARIRTRSEKLERVRQSSATGAPIPWARVHDLPDYAYFNHSAHVRRGVGCVDCHGRVDRMEVVHQAKPLSMGWCLACHRNPEPHLRPVEAMTRMDWVPGEDPVSLGKRLREADRIDPSTDCSTCHR